MGAVLFCGIFMSGYATPHLNYEENVLTSFLLKQMSSIADMFVFLFIGVAVVFVNYNGILFGLNVMLICLVGRAMAVLPLGGVSNFLKKHMGRRKPKEQRHYLSW